MIEGSFLGEKALNIDEEEERERESVRNERAQSFWAKKPFFNFEHVSSVHHFHPERHAQKKRIDFSFTFFFLLHFELSQRRFSRHCLLYVPLESLISAK